jgi:hypothetical protein
VEDHRIGRCYRTETSEKNMKCFMIYTTYPFIIVIFIFVFLHLFKNLFCLSDHFFSPPRHTTRSISPSLHTTPLPVLLPSQVKLQYRKAMLVVHPDRCSSLTTETKFIAKRIFEGSNPFLLLQSHLNDRILHFFKRIRRKHI